MLHCTSIGRFAVDREFVNMENPSESKKNKHLGCLLERLGCLLGYLDMLLDDFQHQDRPKMAPSRTWATLNASAKLFKARVTKSVRVLLKTRI